MTGMTEFSLQFSLASVHIRSTLMTQTIKQSLIPSYRGNFLYVWQCKIIWITFSFPEQFLLKVLLCFFFCYVFKISISMWMHGYIFCIIFPSMS